VIVEPEKPKEVTKGGIKLPSNSHIIKSMGTVIAVGPGRILETGEVVGMPVKKGDKVVWSGSGVPLKDGKKTYLIFTENDLIAVYTGK